MITKKFGDLEVKLGSETISDKGLSYRDFEEDSTTGGVGVNLNATICDVSGKSYTIFQGQVRGKGRHGDDFKHWYKEIEEIREEEGQVYVTLNSGLLRDTYVFNPKDGSVRLSESVDLEEIQKQQNVQKERKKLEGKSLKEIVESVGKIIVERDSFSGTRTPKVIGKVVDEEQGIGVVALAKYKSGYDPVVDTIDLYSIGFDGLSKRLKGIYLSDYGRPKFSSTFVRLEKMELSGNRLTLEGEVMQESFSGLGSSCREVDRISERFDVF